MDGQPTQHTEPGPRKGPFSGFAEAWSRRPILAIVCILGLTILAYLPAMNAGFVFDDGTYVTQDDRMGSVEGLGRIWTEISGPEYRHQYYPLTSSAFWLQHQAWGEYAAGYHLINILLHGLNAILLWRLLRRLRVPGAFLAGAIFAVHPMHVQSVAWVTELKNVLSTAFFLSAALVYLRWFGIAEGTKARRHEGTEDEDLEPRGSLLSSIRPFLYLIGLALFGLALLSKTATALLPLALLLVLWWKRPRLSRRDELGLVPLLLLGAGFVTLTVLLESHHRAHGELFDQTLLERFLIAGRSICFYANKLAWPAELIFIYPRWVINVHEWQQYVFPLSIVVLLAVLWLARNLLGRGPTVAVAYFVLALAPLTFVNVAYTRLSFVADHWSYWASMSLIAFAAAVLVGGARMLRLPPIRWGAGLVGAAAVALLGGLTWQRCHVYRDEETLWSDTVARNPLAWAAHNNLALAMSADGRMDEAMAHFRAAVRINPRYAEGLNNLGAALMLRGHEEEAVRLFDAALRIDPDLRGTHFNRGMILRGEGRLEEAIAAYRESLRVNPRSAETLANLGEALEAAGNTDEAIETYRKALALAPDDQRTNQRLGTVLRDRGELSEAIVHLRRAAELDPGSWAAHSALGSALLAAGDHQQASRHFQDAMRIDPDHAGVLYNLGIAYAGMGLNDEAVSYYETALMLDPDYFEALVNLGVVLQAMGRPQDAIEHFEAAIAINPDHFGARFNLGLALNEVGDIDEALRQFGCAVALRPEDTRAKSKLDAVAAEVNGVVMGQEEQE